ncbi:MAG: membrane protein insertion efficiency factor YidD [Jatrophihabitans sp.]|uniref:membrane protein insertion efficiency factor YidD n=1 Tax=Jatrophihabitans sp. TaxID=1932789 RepID=UPI003F7DEBF6
MAVPGALLVTPRTARAARASAWHAGAYRLGVRDRFLGWALATIGVHRPDVDARHRAVCRFTPSCVHYAAEALETEGLRRGAWLASKRLVRCWTGARGSDRRVPTAR